MLRGLLASLLIVVASVIWYINTEFPVVDPGFFFMGAVEMHSNNMFFRPERPTSPPGPVGASCGDGVCNQELGEHDWTSYRCCAADCNTTCLDQQCISPQQLETRIAQVPFAHRQSFTCAFPDNYQINQRRLQVRPPDEKPPVYTEWQSDPSIATSFFSIGDYTITCQGRYHDAVGRTARATGNVVIDGCTTTAHFGLTDRATMVSGTVGSGETMSGVSVTGAASRGTLPATGETTSGASEVVRTCGDYSALVDMNYLRERVLGDVVDETCKGKFYYSNDLEGVAGICCPAGKICDLNCDLQVSAVDIMLIEQIRKGAVQVELPGDGVDNTCDGQVDCGANPLPYCTITICPDEPPSRASATGQNWSGQSLNKETVVYTNMETSTRYDEVVSHKIGTFDEMIYLALTHHNTRTDTHRIEVLQRKEGLDTWQSLGYAQPEVAAPINIRSIEGEEGGQVYLSYDLGSSATFTLKRYTGEDREDITPTFE